MTAKFLAMVAFAVALLPAVASAESASPATTAQPVTERGPADYASSFLTRVIVPDATNARPIAYADNPELIGHRRGSTNTAWRR